jgi:serine/threonine protein kinase
MGGRPSVEGDVYSYGILLLEMFTGLSPTDERFKDGVSLHEHVEMALPQHIMDMVDSKLFAQTDGHGDDNPHAFENVYDCLVSILRCGILCSKESPKERISIKDVLKELDSARKKLIRP